MFHHDDLSWTIQTKGKDNFAVDEHFTCWCTGGPWCNTIIFQNLHGTIFDYLFVNPRQDRYEPMCGLHKYERLCDKLYDKIIFGGGIPLP